MPGTPSAIPVGSQFSADLVYLRGFLRALLKHSGDKPAMMAAVWEPDVRFKPPTKAPSTRQQSLPLEAAIQYQLLDAGYVATDLARRLCELDDGDLYDEFARHILLNLGGIRVVEAAQQMKLDGLAISGDSLARYLTDQGFTVAIHNTAINSLRMWLAKAGAFSQKGWDVDALRKQELIGVDDETIAGLVGLTAEQRAFAIALCRIDPPGEYLASSVRTTAESILGTTFARDSLPKSVLEPLKALGIITYRSGGTAGGKSSLLRTTPQFRAEVLEPFLENAVHSLDAALTAYYKRLPADIYADLASPNTDIKGRALEAYAVHVMRLMGLRFVHWRRRAKETGGAELDVVFTGVVGGLPTRWQVQCKNTPKATVSVDDVAKEVGLSLTTDATHILILANCSFSNDAINYAREVMSRNSLVVLLLDRTAFDRVRSSPGDLAAVLRAKAEEIAAYHKGSSMWG